MGHRVCSHYAPWLFLVWLLVFSAPATLANQQSGTSWAGVVLSDPEETPDLPDITPGTEKSWFVELGVQISYPRLGRTKDMLDLRLDTPLKLDIFGVFDHPETPFDRRSRGAMGSFLIGFGRNESEYLSWHAYVLGGTGSDSTKQKFLNFRLNTHFDYSTYQLGLKLEAYPWGRPPVNRENAAGSWLKDARPFAYVALETGYISGEGKGVYRMNWWSTAYSDEQAIRDWLIGFPVGIGIRFPITPAISLSLSGDYTFQAYESREYNGWNVLVGLRFELQ